MNAMTKVFEDAKKGFLSVSEQTFYIKAYHLESYLLDRMLSNGTFSSKTHPEKQNYMVSMSHEDIFNLLGSYSFENYIDFLETEGFEVSKIGYGYLISRFA